MGEPPRGWIAGARFRGLLLLGPSHGAPSLAFFFKKLFTTHDHQTARYHNVQQGVPPTSKERNPIVLPAFINNNKNTKVLRSSYQLLSRGHTSATQSSIIGASIHLGRKFLRYRCNHG